MSAAKETADTVSELPVAGPGERLRTARLAAGLDKDKVAAQLHLKPGQIDELERDQYDGFAARVFVRGYLRNYARLVDLSADSVLEAFDRLCPDPDEPKLQPVGSHKPQVSSRHGVVQLFSWLLVLAIVGLFAVWWAGYLELNGSNGGSQVQTLESEQSLTPPPAAQEPGSLPLPPVPAAEAPQPEAEEQPQSELAAQPESPSGQPEQAEAEAQPAVPEVMEVPVALPPATEPVVEPEVSEVAEPPPVVADEIVLSLDGPCWVEVRAIDGSYKLLGEFQAGTRRVLGGNPPYSILLGNATVAILTVGGQAFDLAPHTRQQVARFTLDPAAL
jgi:cytoskeleton protein RodZ